MIIFFFCLERWIPKIAPKDSCHSQLMRHFKSLCYFLDLTGRLVASKIDSSTYCSSTKVPACFYRSKHYLVELIGIGKEFVMIDFYNKRYSMCILAGEKTKSAVSCGYCVTAAFNSELYNVLRI